jgi:hypothetical protein
MMRPFNILSGCRFPKDTNWEIVGSWSLWLFGSIAWVVIFYLIYAPSHPPSGYTGIVSGLKKERSGVLIDLDGAYPNQKMTVWVTKKVVIALHGHWPRNGDALEVTGTVSEYKNRPEIVVSDPSQLTWPDLLVPGLGQATDTMAGAGTIPNSSGVAPEEEPESGVFLNISEIDWIVGGGIVAMIIVSIGIAGSNLSKPQGTVHGK